MRGHAVAEGEGRAYDWRGHFFTMKASGAETNGVIAAWEFITKKGDEPHDHTHDDVDEIFFMLEGSLTVRCGDEVFDAAPGAFVFLPRRVQHGYTITSDGPVRILGFSTPSAFGDNIEATGTPMTPVEAAARRAALAT